MDVIESITMIIENKKASVVGGAGAGAGAAAMYGINKMKQSGVAKSIGQRAIDTTHAMTHGNMKEKLGSMNPANTYHNFKDIAAGVNIKDALPKHLAAGAAAGGALALGVSYANKKLKDRKALKTKSADLQNKLTHQANRTQLQDLHGQQKMQHS